MMETQTLALVEAWANLKRIIQPDSEILQSGEWAAVDELITGQARDVTDPAILPPAIPMSFADGADVVRATVTRKFVNKRLWEIELEDKTLAELWVYPTQTKVMRAGWKIYVRPGASGGYVMHGDYNRYGDRLA